MSGPTQPTFTHQNRIAPTGKAPTIINPQTFFNLPPKDIILTRQSDGNYAYQIRYFSCLAPACTARLQSQELLRKHREERHIPGHPSYLLTTQEAIKARRIEIEARIKISNSQLRRDGKHPDQVNKGPKELGVFVQADKFQSNVPDTRTRERRVGAVGSQLEPRSQKRAVVDLTTTPEPEQTEGIERKELVKPGKREVEIHPRKESHERTVVHSTLSDEPNPTKKTERKEVIKLEKRKVTIDLLTDSEEESPEFPHTTTRVGLGIASFKPSRKESIASAASTGSDTKRCLGHDTLEEKSRKRVKTE